VRPVCTQQHTHTHAHTHTQTVETDGRRIDPSQMPLPDKTQNTHKRQKFIPPAVFELAIPEKRAAQIHALHRTATGNCSLSSLISKNRPGLY
jgi:hypothetical protein